MTSALDAKIRPMGKRAWTVDEETGCWVWQRAMRTGGYGVQQGEAAHRVVYERLKGPVPDGLELDHLCRNKACVNPAHLEAVTHAENIRRSPVAKLTAADILRIRESREPGSVVATAFSISQANVTMIRQGRRWPEVGGIRPASWYRNLVRERQRDN